MRDDQIYNPLKSRLGLTPQGQLIQSPTGAFALYVDLEVAIERVAELEGVIRGSKAIVESMEEQIKTQKLTILQLQEDLSRMAEAMNAEY